MSRRLVEEALKEAISGCVEEHRKRRVLLTDVCLPCSTPFVVTTKNPQVVNEQSRILTTLVDHPCIHPL